MSSCLTIRHVVLKDANIWDTKHRRMSYAVYVSAKTHMRHLSPKECNDNALPEVWLDLTLRAWSLERQ